MKHFFATACAALLLSPAAAQTINVENACSYFGEAMPDTVSTFGSINEAVATLDEIVKSTGLSRNFEIQAASVPNASAVIQGTQRFVLYNPAFMKSMNEKAGTKWAAISILAHEVGHHLNGHTLVPGGSRPPTELQADQFSGFVLQKMGATLDESTAAMHAFGSPVGSATHPAKGERLAAITAGWMQACDSSVSCNSTITPPPVTTSVPQPNSTVPALVYTDQCQINGEVVLITQADQVISQVTNQIVGYKAATYWPGQCIFDLTRADGGRYCVQQSGLVYQGTPSPVGNCSPF